ncbi:hypothetical protein IQ260_14650 [Leptolyngbya cf. ectocarpi LEGE 11479]|uniref:Uncharacterized protein n=1 Tax=Leptolyngbya cf. ectocarpi LEGE 11479 TaxID=1828722 RepID=A0A928ZUW3_LEPEC|nr:hypothetical protein [Leptolyngbya ectocarpi]MBE9067891.1 hypothetical protein [Leptolyngbya cf. ectocarpi LEGE 11479]
MTLAEINRQAFSTLVESLGYVNAVRFFKQFDMGTGDYTRDRQQWLEDVTLDSLWVEIQQCQQDAS